MVSPFIPFHSAREDNVKHNLWLVSCMTIALAKNHLMRLKHRSLGREIFQ